MSGSQLYSIRYNRQHSRFFALLASSRDYLSDISLVAEGGIVKAHKMFLAACSPYFRKMFLETPKEQNLIVLKDVPYAELNIILDFIYTGNINVTRAELDTLLDIAKSLQLFPILEAKMTPITPYVEETSVPTIIYTAPETQQPQAESQNFVKRNQLNTPTLGHDSQSFVNPKKFTITRRPINPIFPQNLTTLTSLNQPLDRPMYNTTVLAPIEEQSVSPIIQSPMNSQHAAVRQLNQPFGTHSNQPASNDLSSMVVDEHDNHMRHQMPIRKRCLSEMSGGNKKPRLA